MNFIQTGFLLGGLAVAIPVLVHLLSRWQVRRVELGTMRFLQEVMQDGARRRKIRRWLLLFTRMAAVALLVLLFARPYLPETIRRDGNRMRVILIDRSASMSMPGQSGRLIDDALAQASEIAGELGTDAKVLWAWFDSDVEPFEASLTRLPSPRSVVGDTNYLAALSWARDRVAADPDSLSDVVLISDLQQSGLASDALDTAALNMPPDLPIRIVDVGRPAANNLAIQTVTLGGKRLSPSRNVKMDVTLFNFGNLPMEEVPMIATASNAKRSVRLKKSINIPSGQAQELAFDFGKLDPGTWQVTVQLDVEDDLAVDNQRLTAFEVAQPAPVVVVDGGSEDQEQVAESFYLSAALQQSNRETKPAEGGESSEETRLGMFAPDVVFLFDESMPEVNPARTALVAVTDSASLSAQTVERLENYVASGGKLIVFAGDGDGTATTQSLWQQSDLAPGEIARPLRSGAMPFRIVSVDAEHSMLSPFGDPQQGDLGRLSFNQILPIVAKESTTVLARFDEDRPAITWQAHGNGQVVWFLSSADSSWGNWPTSPLYLPLVHQMAADLLNLTGEGKIRYRSVGDRREVTELVAANDATGQAGEIRTVSTQNQTQTNLTFARPGFERSGQTLFVVNATSKESDPTRITDEQFVDHFALTPADPDSTKIPRAVQGERQNELWPWLAAAAVVLLTAEFLLANRTTA